MWSGESMSKITRSAKGEECQVRIPGICNYNQETTIFAHLNGYGMGGKHADLFGAYCCSTCHGVIDGHIRCFRFDPGQIRAFHIDGILRTQEMLVRKGLVVLK
jgi:hypothetical protein